MLLTGGASCSCPASGAPDLVLPVGLAPTFQVRFETAGLAQPGIVRIVSKGCSSLGSQCYAGVATPADAEAEVSVLLGLNSALATPPAAAMTVRGSVNLNGGSIGLSNADEATGGITIDAGGTVANAVNARLSSLPGTPGSASILASDPSLTALNADRMFVSLFGMDRTTYRSQPAVVRVSCNGSCAVAIASAVAANPGRIVWVEGNATIDANQVLGSPAPVALFVQGDLTVDANLELHGLLYLRRCRDEQLDDERRHDVREWSSSRRRQHQRRGRTERRLRCRHPAHDQPDAGFDGRVPAAGATSPQGREWELTRHRTRGVAGRGHGGAGCPGFGMLAVVGIRARCA
jgi:hypothetical protein